MSRVSINQRVLLRAVVEQGVLTPVTDGSSALAVQVLQALGLEEGMEVDVQISLRPRDAAPQTKAQAGAQRGAQNAGKDRDAGMAGTAGDAEDGDVAEGGRRVDWERALVSGRRGSKGGGWGGSLFADSPPLAG